MKNWKGIAPGIAVYRCPPETKKMKWKKKRFYTAKLIEWFEKEKKKNPPKDKP